MKKLFASQLLFLALLATCARAQALENIKSPEELSKVVAALDTALFDSYNRCDLEGVGTLS